MPCPAKISDNTYTTLAAALAAAQNGTTVTLLTDVTLSEKIQLGKTVTLDLNGHTLTYSGEGYIDVSDGAVSATGSGTIMGVSGDTAWSFDAQTGADGNTAYKSIDGVLYALENGNPVTLLLCPAAKTGTITVPATVTSLAKYSFYSNNSGYTYTSLSRIEFAPRAAGTLGIGEWDESEKEYIHNSDVFGSGYTGGCVLAAPAGMRANDAATIPVKGIECSLLTFRAVTDWDAL